MKQKKTKSVLAIILAILLLLILVFSLGVNIAFSRSDTPELFGYYFYMMESDTMEASDSADEESAAASIHQNTLVIAKALSDSDLPSKNNPILCVLADTDTSSDIDSDRVAVRRILSVEQDDSGILYYYPTTMQQELVGTEPAITRDNILGICTKQMSQMYTFLNFERSAAGIVLLIALPAVILVVMMIVAIARASSNRSREYAFQEEYDEVYSEDNYDDTGYPEDLGERSPLYRTGGGRSFEEKRSSIAENFERKQVNPNSPYQKARTMQFKAQSDVPIYTDPDDQLPIGQSAPADDYQGTHAGAVSNTGTFGTHEVISHAADTPISNTQTISARSSESSSSSSTPYRGSHEASSPEEARGLGSGSGYASASSSSRYSASSSSSRPVSSHEAKPQTRSSSRNKYENASVDDLLAMIEDEKKKRAK